MSDSDHGIIRAADGKFLPGTGKDTRFTSETARAAAIKRHEDAEEEARQALVRRFQEGGMTVNTAPEAWGELVGEIAAGAQANAMDRPHDAARAAAFVGRATDVLRPVEPAGRDMPATGAVLQLSEAAAEYIGRVLVQAAARAAAGPEADADG